MAAILRAERRGPAIIRGEVHDAQQEAAALLAAARGEAERIRARAEAESLQLREAAAAERESARAEASAEAAARGLAERNAQAARALVELAVQRARTVAELERAAQRAVLQVASKLLESTLSAEPERIASLVAAQLTRVRRAHRVCLRLHPADAGALAPALRRLAAQVELDGVLELVSDPGLARGGCVIESNLGEIDARLETRVTLLAHALGWLE